MHSVTRKEAGVTRVRFQPQGQDPFLCR